MWYWIAIEMDYMFRPYAFMTVDIFSFGGAALSDYYIHEMTNEEAALYFFIYWVSLPLIGFQATIWSILLSWVYIVVFLYIGQRLFVSSVMRSTRS